MTDSHTPCVVAEMANVEETNGKADKLLLAYRVLKSSIPAFGLIFLLLSHCIHYRHMGCLDTLINPLTAYSLDSVY